ncbi:MAG: hypothetical protein KBD12_01415 [Candidatus Pacebacteria bacterium]|nr:hypothetical protein [Candidatus Paceibacterota bacterium]
MLELYLSSIILYSILAFIFGALIGYSTLTQHIPKGSNFDFFAGFKKFKLTMIFEKVYGVFAKLVKALTGIDINPEIKK